MGPAYTAVERSASPNECRRDYLDTQEEVLFMQVFVEEVGLWMDSMDSQKHVSSSLPIASPARVFADIISVFATTSVSSPE